MVCCSLIYTSNTTPVYTHRKLYHYSHSHINLKDDTTLNTHTYLLHFIHSLYSSFTSGALLHSWSFEGDFADTISQNSPAAPGNSPLQPYTATDPPVPCEGYVLFYLLLFTSLLNLIHSISHHSREGANKERRMREDSLS